MIAAYMRTTCFSVSRDEIRNLVFPEITVLVLNDVQTVVTVNCLRI